MTDAAVLTICSTCRHSPEISHGTEGVSGGRRLLDAVRSEVAARGEGGSLRIEEVACLWACKDHCTVHLRAPDKPGYLMGRFKPDDASARSILDYAAAYIASADGAVPFRQWPEGVKGHFIARLPKA